MNQNDNLNENPLLNQPLADLRKVDPQFYIDEFLRWLSEECFETAQSDKFQTDRTITHND